MKREITTHKINGLNEALTIAVLDEPGHGNACHQYAITTPGKPLRAELRHPTVNCEIQFQNGPIKESGVNGISIEALLAIVRDRLEGFQQGGPYACVANRIALVNVIGAMDALLVRTLERTERGVEGTHQK